MLQRPRKKCPKLKMRSVRLLGTQSGYHHRSCRISDNSFLTTHLHLAEPLASFHGLQFSDSNTSHSSLEYLNPNTATMSDLWYVSNVALTALDKTPGYCGACSCTHWLN